MSDKHLPEEPRPISAALNHFRAHGGMLCTRDALVAGIHPRTLYALRDSGRDWRSRPLTSPWLLWLSGISWGHWQWQSRQARSSH